MNFIYNIIKEQFTNFTLIFRLAFYEVKSKYMMHYLGMIWELLNPIIQIALYWFVIGIGIRGSGDINGVPFIIWLLTGMTPWIFINRSIVQGSNSVIRRVGLVSKMKFPVSVLPTISIISSAFIFIVLLLVLFGITSFYGIEMKLQLIQIPYFILSMIVFLFALTLMTSAITVIVRDIQSILQQLMRVLFYLCPIVWDPSHTTHLIESILKLNPIYYLISGFRSSILGSNWFYDDISYTIYFWSFTLTIFLIGAAMQIKLRNRFIDYI